MFILTSTNHYFLYDGYCDMRKSFDGLSGLVLNNLHKDPAGGDVFIFLNKRRNFIKLLHYEDGGFVIYYKRLERGRFSPPAGDTSKSSLTWTDLVLMVEGIMVLSSRRQVRFCRKNK